MACSALCFRENGDILTKWRSKRHGPSDWYEEKHNESVVVKNGTVGMAGSVGELLDGLLLKEDNLAG